MVKDLKVGDKVLFHGPTQVYSGNIPPIYHGAIGTVAAYDAENMNVAIINIEYGSIFRTEDGWIHLIQIEKILAEY